MKKKNKSRADHNNHEAFSFNGDEPKGGKHGKNKEKLSKRSLHPTRNDMPEKDRLEVCQLLNQSLADTFDMYSQTKQAHWNVKGVHFYQLHLLFDEIAGELLEFVDLVAERITTLGGTAFGTVRMAAEGTELPEYPVGNLAGMDHVVALSDRLAQFGESIRANIDACDQLGDKDTADIYTEISRDVDKRLWFLEAHLQAPTAERETRREAVETGSRH
jgi:starvation-inducible DNA-binding protein